MTEEVGQGNPLPEDPPAAEEVTVETPVPAETEVEVPEEKQPDESPEKISRNLQKRIDRLTRQKYEERARRELVEQELARLRNEPRQPAQAAPTDGEPKPESYSSYEAYLEARAEWKAGQTLRQHLSALQQNQIAAQQMAQVQAAASAWQKQVETASGKYADWEDVIEVAGETPITPVMQQLVPQLPNGADVVYWLAKNQEEAARISTLPPVMQVMELGAIAKTLQSGQKQQPSAAPRPINPVRGNAGSASSDPAKMSAEAYIRWKNEQEAKSRRK